MRKPYEKLSRPQQRATLNNNCLRNLAALERAFRLAGHYDFEQLTHALDSQFRTKLKETTHALTR